MPLAPTRNSKEAEIIVKDSLVFVMVNSKGVEVGNGYTHAWIGISVGNTAADND